MVQKPDREAEELDYPDERAAKKQQNQLDTARRQHSHRPFPDQAVDPQPKSEDGPEGLPQR